MVSDNYMERFERLRDSAWGMLSSSIGEERADEAIQRTMLTIWHLDDEDLGERVKGGLDAMGGPDGQRSSGVVLAYITSMANKADRESRIGPERRDQSRAYGVEHSLSPEYFLEQEETIAVVREALGTLPEQLREPLMMHYAEGLSFSATARELGVPQSTVRDRVHRGRDQLKRELSSYTA